jgi:rubrerythrin
VSADLARSLERCRAAEKEQALLYRALAALAEEREDAELSQRFHDLHADEQHHLSRLTARLLELGERPPDLAGASTPEHALDDWEPLVRRREAEEIRRYEALLAADLDGETRALLEGILEVERHHAEELGGKWTAA